MRSVSYVLVSRGWHTMQTWLHVVSYPVTRKQQPHCAASQATKQRATGGMANVASKFSVFNTIGRLQTSINSSNLSSHSNPYCILNINDNLLAKNGRYKPAPIPSSVYDAWKLRQSHVQAQDVILCASLHISCTSLAASTIPPCHHQSRAATINISAL